MKKVIAAAAGLMMVGVTASSAFAVENIFGGYWRTRAYTQIDFNGQDSGSYSRVDTRTRLYYTAKFNDRFKFVNKFEIDQVWGDNVGGDIGTDGKGIIEVKQSYADFRTDAIHAKVGMQFLNLGHKMLFYHDFAGAVVSMKAGAATIPFLWMKVDEEHAGNATEGDVYGVMPKIKVDGMKINPYLLTYMEEGEDTSVYWAGADLDMKMGGAKVWATGVYQFGERRGMDSSAYLLAGGAKAGAVHGQAFVASGDDDATDDENNAFFVIPTGNGTLFHWSEIMGRGIFNNRVSNGSPGWRLTNIWAANVGFKVKPMDKLTVGADLWYAALMEENAAGDTELGIELDLKATYKIYKNLSLDLVAAYLLAGDATGEEDPIEVGARLSLKF